MLEFSCYDVALADVYSVGLLYNMHVDHACSCRCRCV